MDLSLCTNKCWLQLMHRLFYVGSIPYSLLLTESDIFIKMMEELVLPALHCDCEKAVCLNEHVKQMNF